MLAHLFSQRKGNIYEDVVWIVNGARRVHCQQILVGDDVLRSMIFTKEPMAVKRESGKAMVLQVN